MIVRFASTCDTCNESSEEYTEWPTCRECFNHVCNLCYAESTLITGDGDGPDTCLCRGCQNSLESDE